MFLISLANCKRPILGSHVHRHVFVRPTVKWSIPEPLFTFYGEIWLFLLVDLLTASTAILIFPICGPQPVWCLTTFRPDQIFMCKKCAVLNFAVKNLPELNPQEPIIVKYSLPKSKLHFTLQVFHSHGFSNKSSLAMRSRLKRMSQRFCG